MVYIAVVDPEIIRQFYQINWFTLAVKTPIRFILPIIYWPCNIGNNIIINTSTES